MDELVAQWNRFKELPFPEGLAGEEIEGEDLVSLDTFSAGCISTFLGNKGKLDYERRNILKSCITGLQNVIPNLPNEEQGYFKELLSMSLGIDGKLKSNR